MDTLEKPLAKIADSKETLLDYLQKEARQHRGAAKLKSASSKTLFVLAIVASFITAINTPLAVAGQGFLDKLTAAIIAAFPALTIALANTLQLPSDAKWHQVKKRKLESLHLRLSSNFITIEKAVEELVTTLDELDKTRAQLEAPNFE